MQPNYNPDSLPTPTFMAATNVRQLGRLMAAIVLISAGCAGHDALRRADPADPLSMVVQIYRGPLNHLAAVRRGTTPMYPATSVYALESLQKHGPLIGSIMTCDRLLRAGRDETTRAPAIAIGSRIFSYDPVSANDFWWRPSDPDHTTPAP